MILNERDARHEHILQVARQMMTASPPASDVPKEFPAH